MSNPSPTYFTALRHEGLLRIEGPEASKFLQGQVTCDLRQLSDSTTLPGAYCTPQGRVVCDFLLGQTAEDQLALRMRRDLLPLAAQTFGKYIVFSRAEVAPLAEDWQLYGCWGGGSAALLQAELGALPQCRYGAVATVGVLAIQLDEAGERFELWLQGDSGRALADTLAANSTAADSDAWIALDIVSGLGRVEAATSEEFVPQMLNYDLTGHISFSKGCYTGQEVVARLHYRGTPKRRLYPLRAGDLEVPSAGAAIYAGGEQSIGNIVNAVRGADGTLQASAVLTVAKAEEALQLAAADGPAVAAAQPPYPLQAEE